MLSLLDLHLPGKKVVFGLETTRVVFIIIKEMDTDTRFPQIIEQGGVGIQASKTIEIRYSLHGDEFWCAFPSGFVDGSEL